MSNKIYTIVGNRPQFIKVDPKLKQRIIHTGQHHDYKMSQIFFKELKLPKPYKNLGCKSNESGKMYDKMVELFKKDKPGLVVVYGDTLSTMMGALAAAFCNIPIAHIEAGCRSFNMEMPEEISRIITDRLAKIGIAFTRDSHKNLINEKGNTDRHTLYIKGDPMFDAMQIALPAKRYNYHKYILVTIHRNFNTDDHKRLKQIIQGLNECKDETFVWPVHPRTKKELRKAKLHLQPHVQMIDPVGYKQMIKLESNAKKILTDSGGVMREAYWMRIPCIVVRNETEWPYIVRDGWAVLVEADKKVVSAAIKHFNPESRTRQSELPEYGVHAKIRNKLAMYL